MKLLDERGLTTVWAAIKNMFTSKLDADGKYAKKSEAIKAIKLEKTYTGGQGGTSQFIRITKANGEESFLSIYNANNIMDGFMSKEDKVKLDGIASGANNYTLPVASADTLGGIKVGYGGTLTGFNFPVKLDDEGNAVATIDGLFCISGVLKSIEFMDNNTSTNYGINSIHKDTHSGKIRFDFPSKAGTFALISDIPTKTSQLTNDSTFLTSADKYTLPTASDTALGGIKVSENAIGTLYPITVNDNGFAHASIIGINKNSLDGTIKNIIVKNNNYTTTYTSTAIHMKDMSQGNKLTLLNFPSKSGVLATQDDIPNVSNLCRFNFVNSISDCVNGRINFLFKNSNDYVDLSFLNNLEEGTILLIYSPQFGFQITDKSSVWYYNGTAQAAYDTTYINHAILVLAFFYNTYVYVSTFSYN